MSKHFLRTFFIFIGMIILGLIGVYLINYFDKEESKLLSIGNNKSIEVAN